ncbi:MAG: ABC transporter ATP-binding protein [Bacteroidota bacterium]|jgi:subfamily B ATP-binding cassette protein MsbA|nr:ABC transporter ATP-binding protein/permease [Chitinophagaceae bacterium]
MPNLQKGDLKGMRSLAIIFNYIKKYPKLVFGYFSLNLLSALFSLVSLTMLAPFLTLIFELESKGVSLSSRFSFGVLSEKLYTHLGTLNGSTEGKIEALAILCIIIISAIVLKNIFLYGALYVLTPIRNGIINDMRNDMFDKIVQLPIGFFNEQRKGDIMSRLTNDLQDVEFSTISFLETFFREPILIFCYLFAMIHLSPELSLFLLLFLPVSGLIIGRIGRSLKKVSSGVQIKLGDILSTIEETLGGIRIVKAFNAEFQQLEKFKQENRELLSIKNRSIRRRDLASPVSETLGIVSVCCVLYYGGRLVLKTEVGLSGQDFLTFIVIFTQVINPLKSFSTASYNIQKGAASIDRIQQLIHEEQAVKEKADAQPIANFNKTIELRNVSFFYTDKQILKNINLTIQKGQTIALVGSSGSGKSTLADLIPRFHDCTEGEVLIDGIDIKNYKIKDLRNLMGIVTQEPILFNDTIKANISLGNKSAVSDQIKEAANIANASSFIEKKEKGFDTVVGDRGSKLSGGERQRITIARAVLKNPPILILDEATSSLDTESEKWVQDAIYKLMKDRTSIIIAHRLSTIKHADEIIVMDGGSIVERGRHDELIQRNGIYSRLVSLQQMQ